MVTSRGLASTDLSVAAGPLCIGIDVSKDWLDIADTAGRALRIANTVGAITEALAGPWSQGCRAMVCEATGGYERPLMRVAAQLGLPLRRVHPNRVRAFAQAAARLGLRPMRSMPECSPASPPSSPTSRPGPCQRPRRRRSPPSSAGSINWATCVSPLPRATDRRGLRQGLDRGGDRGSRQPDRRHPAGHRRPHRQ
jgi:hypothetical protein